MISAQTRSTKYKNTAACILAVVFLYEPVRLIFPYCYWWMVAAHEAFHGIVAMATGGQILQVIFMGDAGATVVRNGLFQYYALAGYALSSLFGGLLLMLILFNYQRLAIILLGLLIVFISFVVIGFVENKTSYYVVLLVSYVCFMLSAARFPSFLLWFVCTLFFGFNMINGYQFLGFQAVQTDLSAWSDFVGWHPGIAPKLMMAWYAVSWGFPAFIYYIRRYMDGTIGNLNG